MGILRLDEAIDDIGAFICWLDEVGRTGTFWTAVAAIFSALGVLASVAIFWFTVRRDERNYKRERRPYIIVALYREPHNPIWETQLIIQNSGTVPARDVSFDTAGIIFTWFYQSLDIKSIRIPVLLPGERVVVPFEERVDRTLFHWIMGETAQTYRIIANYRDATGTEPFAEPMNLVFDDIVAFPYAVGKGTPFPAPPGAEDVQELVDKRKAYVNAILKQLVEVFPEVTVAQVSDGSFPEDRWLWIKVEPMTGFQVSRSATDQRILGIRVRANETTVVGTTGWDQRAGKMFLLREIALREGNELQELVLP